MNIFKVLASGKKSFQEETASAVLAWFLNPTMEHGLGYTFISKLINEISLITGNTDLSALAAQLTPKLRSEYEEQLKIWFNLEYKVDNAFIDIIFGIDDWIIAIENKIYATSVTKGQLSREYKGLKAKDPSKKIVLIYLVPIEEDSEILDGKTENEFNELSVIEPDTKALVTWQRNDVGNPPSISEIFRTILAEENLGAIDPLPEYTRHTLKALISFISNDFFGYDYDRKAPSSGKNRLTEEVLPIHKLTTKITGYIGVRGGIRGLVQMDIPKIKTHKFQYSSQDMSNKPYWIEVDTFKKITSWLLHNEIQEIDWRGNLPSKQLYMIAKDFGSSVYIGIKGGEKALTEMSVDIIKNKNWGISTEQATAQWIDGKSFVQIIQAKSVY